MHIHFVCSGNSYRSRLAEAYLKSILSSKELFVSSSGIEVDKFRLSNGPICWYAMRLMKRHNLIPFMSWSEQQTTASLLKDVDLLICMTQKQLDYCQKNLGYRDKPHEVWNIPDLNEMEGFIPSTRIDIKIDINHIQLTEEVYELIVQKVSDLHSRLT